MNTSEKTTGSASALKMLAYEHEEFGIIRATIIDGEPWFIGKDVAIALNCSDAKYALACVGDEDKQGFFESKCALLNMELNKDDFLDRELMLINESGLYTLILENRSAPGTRLFKLWIADEVLPSIHRDSDCIFGEGVFPDEDLLAKALEVARRNVSNRNAVNGELIRKNLLLASKVEMLESIVEERNDAIKSLTATIEALTDIVGEFCRKDQEGAKV